MQKIKNKFIIFIITIIVGIISFGVFSSFFDKKINRDSNVILLKGKAVLNSTILKTNEGKKLIVGDTVRTIGNNTLAVLEWGDGSVTRLGGNTSIKIQNLYVSEDLNKINIGFKLLSGKSWSNVISFLGEGSYFKEYFRDSEAAVRGTVFNVDLTSDYLYVTNHKVELKTNKGKNITVETNKPLSIKDFTFIQLSTFFNNIKDKTWENVNIQFDNKFIKGLKSKIYKDLDSISKITDINIDDILLLGSEEKLKLYNNLMTEYQKLNIVTSENDELFKIKLDLKSKLIKLANNKNKEILVQNTLYDFEDILKSKNYENAVKILTILSENKNILKNAYIEKYLNKTFLPEELKNILLNNFNELKGFFGNFKIIKNINVNNVKNEASSLINKTLDTGLEKVNTLLNK